MEPKNHLTAVPSDMGRYPGAAPAPSVGSRYPSARASICIQDSEDPWQEVSAGLNLDLSMGVAQFNGADFPRHRFGQGSEKSRLLIPRRP